MSLLFYRRWVYKLVLLTVEKFSGKNIFHREFNFTYGTRLPNKCRFFNGSSI